MDLVYRLHHCDAHSLTLRVNECNLLIGGKQMAQSVLDWHNFSQVPNRPLGFLAGRPLTNSITFLRSHLWLSNFFLSKISSFLNTPAHLECFFNVVKQ